ncbi:hypothetical protein KAR91_06265 [Candidatus Pacearchaeota archaeon]|nr:hypothetical protein [Candidatus Pacearchaeota archaeon]
MKRFMLVVLVLMLSAGVAIAGQFYTAPNSTSNVVLPQEDDGWPTINSISFTATNATGDVTVYGGDSTSVISSDGKAATATTFNVSTCVGMDDADIVVIQQTPTRLTKEAHVIESASMSSCVETTLIMTLGAGTANAYNGTNGFTFYEMKLITTLANVGTTKINYLTGPLWGGDWKLPMTVRITGGTIHWMSGEWR